MSIRYFLFSSWLSTKGFSTESTLYIHALTPPCGSVSLVREYIGCSVNHFTNFLSTHYTQSPLRGHNISVGRKDVPESTGIISALCYFCTTSTNAERSKFLQMQDECQPGCPSTHPLRIQKAEGIQQMVPQPSSQLFQANH